VVRVAADVNVEDHLTDGAAPRPRRRPSWDPCVNHRRRSAIGYTPPTACGPAQQMVHSVAALAQIVDRPDWDCRAGEALPTSPTLCPNIAQESARAAGARSPAHPLSTAEPIDHRMIHPGLQPLLGNGLVGAEPLSLLRQPDPNTSTFLVRALRIG
jgi:hypothetical protein